VRYAIRRCKSVEELKECVRLQQEIWGYSEREAYPARLLVNLERVGGNTLGAFTPKNEIAGFVISMPAWRGRRRYFHSLALGVKAGHQNHGLGRALKLAQRKTALRQGIGWIEWTFDPLRAKNAFFNIERLGATARQYVPDYYGPVSSRFQLGLPSDRLIAQWQLNSARVARVLSGVPARALGKPATVEVEIPSDLDAWAAADPERVRDRQAKIRRQLQRWFAQGRVITGFRRGPEVSSYLLD
jgi:predicted GNAT superfamily acetyltransferase